jgi:hypothetical protein
MMAAAILTKNADQFGFAANDYALAPVLSGTAKDAEVTPKELGEENISDDTSEDPAEAKDADPKAVADLVPDGDDDLADDEEEDAAKAVDNGKTVMTPSVYMVANPNEQILEFAIKGPADLFAISKASGLPYSAIKMLNPELARWCTPPSMKTYHIKLPLSAKDRFLRTYNADNFDRRVVFMEYKVRKDDSLVKIAKRYAIEADPIREINKLSKFAEVGVGKTIFLPVPTGYKRVIASMYDDKPSSDRRGRRRGRRYRRTSSSEVSEQRHYRLTPKLNQAKRDG